MNIVRYVVAIALAIPGLLFIYVNWRIFWLYYIKKDKTPHSGIPIIGAVLLCIAFAIIPNNPYVWLCWLAFIIDYGSLPGLMNAVIRYKNKSKK